MSALDICIVIAYLAITLGIGIAYRGRQDNAEDYFMAGGSMRSSFQTILVGFSIAATLFSGISFVMYPATVYKKGITVLFMLISFPIAWIVLRYWFLTRFLSQGVRHPYDVIERKFGPKIRTLTALLYTGLRIGWMAILVHAPTIAILAATGLSDQWRWPLLLFIGIGSTLYTTLGGIRGVIITDAMQFMVIALGVIATVVFIWLRLPASAAAILTDLRESGSFRLDFSFNPQIELGVWAVVIGACVGNIANWTSDQMSLQRYLANGSVRAAARSTAYNLMGSFAVVLLLVLVGLSLTAWYHYYPDPSLPSSQDKVFPYFIASQLPVGTAGLLLAAILAATISSMTSGVNTLAATITFDFRLRYGSPMAPTQQLRFGRITTLVVGVSSTLIAGFVGALGTIFQMAQFVLGLFAGPIFVCVILSIVKTSIGRRAMGLGMVMGFMAGLFVRQGLGWYQMWTAPVTSIVTLLGAWSVTRIRLLSSEFYPARTT